MGLPMRIVYLMLLLAACCTAAVAKTAPANKPQSVSFGGHQLFFAFAGKDFEEYIPRGETLEHWNRLVSIRRFGQLDDVEKYAERLADVVKQSNARSKPVVAYNSKTKVAIIDFVAWPADDSYTEFNIFRVEPAKTGQGIVAYQYAVREYQDTKKFMRALKDLRAKTIREMTDRGLTIHHSADDASAVKPPASSKSR
jgi:hypothetical protein